jgi:hypothetical protein
MGNRSLADRQAPWAVSVTGRCRAAVMELRMKPWAITHSAGGHVLGAQCCAHAQSDGLGAAFTLVTRFSGTETGP